MLRAPHPGYTPPHCAAGHLQASACPWRRPGRGCACLPVAAAPQCCSMGSRCQVPNHCPAGTEGKWQGNLQQRNRATPKPQSQGKEQDVPWLSGRRISLSCCPSALVCWQSACPSPPGERRGSPGGRRCQAQGSSPAGEMGQHGQPPVSSADRGNAHRDASSSQVRLQCTRWLSLNLCSLVSQMPLRLEGCVSCRKSLMLYVPGPSLSCCRRKKMVRIGWASKATLPMLVGHQDKESGSNLSLTCCLRFFSITLNWKWGS